MKSLILMAMAFVVCQPLSAQSDSIGPNYFLPKVKTKSDGLQTISPVSILDFKVQRLSKSRVLISWHTEDELNSNGFALQRRLEDEGEFKDVAFIKPKSKGDSTLVNDYTFTDSNDFNGPSYYRLKQKDGKGSTFYTAIRMLKEW
jgi:hypothetical protein